MLALKQKQHNSFKKILLKSKVIEYFSNECSAQYKNYKNLLNLTFHERDFDSKASWSFFATSHGKSAAL